MTGPVGAIGLEQSLTKAFDGELPSVLATANSGVTAVGLSPGGGRMASGVISVVKTFGPAKERVARPVGGVLFDLTGSPASDATRKQIDSMLDTGVDASHPDLRGALAPGWDFVGHDADPRDDNGHGTAVAGCSARARTIASAARALLALPDHAAQGPRRNRERRRHGDRGRDRVGGRPRRAGDQPQPRRPGLECRACRRTRLRKRAGAIIVAAAGNAGVTTQFFPAADRHAVSVAATTVADRRYSWSNFGRGFELPRPAATLRRCAAAATAFSAVPRPRRPWSRVWSRSS